MSLFGFGGEPKPQQQQQPPAAGQQTPAGQPPAAVADGQVKPDTVDPTDPTAGGSNNPDTTASPLDSFSGLFDNTGEDTGEAPSLAISDAVLAGVNNDFTAGMPPELSQAMSTMDADQMAVMKHMVSQAYKASMQHGAAVNNDFMKNSLEHYGSKVDSSVQKGLSGAELSRLPNADNPIIKRELDRVSEALRKKYPNAPPKYIADQSQKYLNELGDQLRSPDQGSQPTTPPDEVDFNALLSEGM